VELINRLRPRKDSCL